MNRLSAYKNNFARTRKLSVYYGFTRKLSVFDKDCIYEGGQKMLSEYDYKKNQLSHYKGFMYMLSDYNRFMDTLSGYDGPDKEEVEDG
jgi:hypothetical protein